MHGLAYTLFSSLLARSLAVVLPRIEQSHVALEVELSRVIGSSISAVMTNAGSESLKLLDYGTLMDKNPVQRLSVVKNGAEVAFTGMGPRYQMADLPEDAFTTLAPEESFTSIINIAALHDVKGGDYDILAVGAIPYAALDSTEIVGSVPYASNTLSMRVLPEHVQIIPNTGSVLGKRLAQAECDDGDEEDSEFKKSLGQLVDLAQRAAIAAREGDMARFEKFFKTTDPDIRAAVAARFETVSREASTTGGLTTYYCQDPNGYCTVDSLSYALPSQDVLVNCPQFYSLPSLSEECGAQDQTTTVLYELLRAPTVLVPAAQNLAFGVEASLQLNSQQAFLNADTYAFYANAVLNNCS